MNILNNAVLAGLLCVAASAQAIDSPDRSISVKVALTPQQTLTYSVARNSKAVILPSALGLELAGINLANKLTLGVPSRVRAVHDRYQMAVGKQFSRSDIGAGKAAITLKPRGGFVAVFK